VLALAACSSSKSSPGTSGGGSGSNAPSKKSLKVGLAYDVGGRGDKSFNDLAAAGLEKAKNDLNIQTKELSAVQGESDQQKQDRLELLAKAGYNPIIAVGFAYAPALKKAATNYPNVKFAIIDPDTVHGSVFKPVGRITRTQ
jgi:basic membrane protein A